MLTSTTGIDSGSASEPLDLPDVIQQTFDVLLQVLPAELNATMRLDRTGTLMNVSDSQYKLIFLSCLYDLKCTSVTLSLTPDLHTCLNSLWNIVRASNERGNSAPLPTYIYGTFANSAMTQRLHEHRDLAVRMIGRCVGALVASKLQLISAHGPIRSATTSWRAYQLSWAPRATMWCSYFATQVPSNSQIPFPSCGPTSTPSPLPEYPRLS